MKRQRGPRTRLEICLTPQDRQTLEAWQRASTMPVGQVRRGRILLLLDAGVPITQIAATVGISRKFVYKWVARFQAQGVGGLADLPRPRPARRRRVTAGREDEL
jgi:hypothetical protein